MTRLPAGRSAQGGPRDAGEPPAGRDPQGGEARRMQAPAGEPSRWEGVHHRSDGCQDEGPVPAMPDGRRGRRAFHMRGVRADDMEYHFRNTMTQS